MALWEFNELAPILQAVGIAAAAREPLDTEGLAAELDRSSASLEMVIDQLNRMGLVLVSEEDEDLPPLLTRAGSQYLQMEGNVPDEVLHFLPAVIDDLHARTALLRGGTILVDEFRYQVLQGEAVFYAKEVVPPAFVGAVDEAMAIDLFAAAIGLMARLSCGYPAGCLAEEILAVSLLDQASGWIELEAEKEQFDAEDVRAAKRALRGIFELFEDDDVLNLFEMEEPSDAAVAGHSPINLQAGVVDQRVESWFSPFGGVPGTGHLDERVPADQ